MDILICDDNANARKDLKEKLIEYQFMRNIDYKISEYSSGEALLNEGYIGTAILFLDIRMQGMNGIETAKQIRKVNRNLIIVFLTAYKEYVFEGYKVNAFRYLLKPVDKDELIETMDSIERMLKKEDDILLLSFGKEKYCIRLNEIMFIEVRGRKIWVHSENHEYRSVGSLEELEEKLKNDSFFRVHKSFIVNFEHIIKFDNKNIFLKNEKIVPISRLRLQEFKKAYSNFWERFTV